MVELIGQHVFHSTLCTVYSNCMLDHFYPFISIQPSATLLICETFVDCSPRNPLTIILYWQLTPYNFLPGWHMLSSYCCYMCVLMIFCFSLQLKSLMDLTMMAFNPSHSRLRTEEEIYFLLEQTGFVEAQTYTTRAGYSIVEAFPTNS